MNREGPLEDRAWIVQCFPYTNEKISQWLSYYVREVDGGLDAFCMDAKSDASQHNLVTAIEIARRFAKEHTSNDWSVFNLVTKERIVVSSL